MTLSRFGFQPSKKTLLVLGLPALLMVVAPGCAKDRTIDDYNRQKAAEDLARIPNDSFTGTLTSSVDGSDQGKVVVTISPDTGVVQGNDGTVEQAQTKGSITYVDSSSTRPFDTATYNWDRGTLTAEFSILQQASTNGTGQVATTKRVIDLHATLSNGKLVGEIEALDYPGYGGKFTLTSSGSSSTEAGNLTSTHPSHPQNAANASLFCSKINLINNRFGKSDPNAALTITQYDPSNDEIFLSRLMPVTYLTVNLRISPTFPIYQKEEVEWDHRSGGFRAVLPGKTDYATLTCNEYTSDDLKQKGWTCSASGATWGQYFSNAIFLPYNGTPAKSKKDGQSGSNGDDDGLGYYPCDQQQN